MKIVTKKHKTMKSKIFLTLIMVVLTTIIINAQSPILSITTERGSNIPDGAYLKDTNNVLDKFTGTWQYTQGNDTLTISIQKITQHFNGSYYKDKLIGGYKYVQNGKVLVNNISPSSDDLLISGSLIKSNDLNLIHLSFKDSERKRISYRLDLTYIRPGLQNPSAQLIWNLRITQIGFCGALPNRPAPSDEECRKDNRLPLNLTLTKIN